MPDVKQFAGLPIGLLICTPIIEVAKGQAALCDVYLNTLFKLAYKDGKADGETNIIKFKLERPVTDGQGNVSTQTVAVNAPLLALVPIPAFTMDEITVDFTMEIHDQSSTTNTDHEEASASGSFSYWGFSAQISGKVSHDKSVTNSSGGMAEYKIHARACQQPPSEGMAKLTSLFAGVIEPIVAK